MVSLKQILSIHGSACLARRLQEPSRAFESLPNLHKSHWFQQHMPCQSTRVAPMVSNQVPKGASDTPAPALAPPLSSRLNKLIRRAGSVVGMKLDSLVAMAERRTSNRLLAILDNVSHPLHTVISHQRSSFSNSMLLPKCNTNRLKNKISPRAIKLYNTSHGRRQRQRRTEVREEHQACPTTHYIT